MTSSKLTTANKMSDLLNKINKRLSTISEEANAPAKHRQLSEAILALMEDGDIKPGDRLPTETALASGLPFSLGTIQKALRTLSELGVVNRKAGRGTVFAERSGEIFDLWQFRFVDRDTGQVFPVFSKVTGLERIAQNGPWSDFLGKEDRYVRIAREIDVDHRFKLMNYFYLSDRTFGAMAELEPSALEGVHLSAVIRRMFHVSTIRTKNRVACSTIPDPICLHLNLPSAARGIVCDILGFAPGDQPLSFQQVYVPADADPMEFREMRPS